MSNTQALPLKFSNFRIHCFTVQSSIMFKIFLLLSLIAVIACNNDSKNSSAATTNPDSASVKGGFTWADDEEKEFLADCVESAKANVGDTIAFKQCNCVLK